MAHAPRPRIPNITAITGADIVLRREKQIASDLESVRKYPDKQRCHRSLASSYEVLGLELYALGYPMEQVLDVFQKAVASRMEVFRLRGTYKYSCTTYGRKPGESPVTVEKIDFATTCSWSGFRATCVAMATGEDEAAKQFASLIWDPPDADYVGRNSEACTPEQQNIAYVFRNFFSGSVIASLSELNRISSLWKVRGFPKDTSHIALMVKGLGTADSSEFLQGLNRYLEWHTHEAKDEANRSDRHLFVSLPALGLASVGLTVNLVKLEELPSYQPYLPLEFLAGARERRADQNP